MTTTSNATLTIADIQHINRLCIVEHMNNAQIADATGFSLADIDAVIRGVYVDDLAEQWKPDEEITLADYNAIRKRYQPGKLHRDTEFMIARDMLIRPETVLAIAHSRFSNLHTHPVPKAVKSKPEKPQTMRRLSSADLDEAHKLERFGWPVAEIAGKLEIPVEAAAQALRLMRNRWSYPDILEDVNTRYGAK
ncbi:hypothetical protein Q6W08_004267 [Escherichia coli]|uniref:hypothetical protein n=1 Tax=Escherichia coli TaxID=562 RepID=UPI001FD65D9A|nr:hypothetical protein [Escherichia coli]EIM8664684.1 hypothetical protein [Escherichia coli]EJH1308174.1 hypothetical protein [Escherichia coli]ELG6518094.1 hypothetical protein [Escherichia coli]ELH6646239.1 hypothetical protein [Escherichia coli]ELH6674164.1 hypothetical protein [Escherichia coli]